MDNFYIKKVLSGDRNAFRYFIRTYKNMAFSIALSLTKQEEQAEEIVQEAFIQTYLSLSKFKGNSKFSTWFYRIFVNCGYKHLRKNSAAKSIELDVEVHDITSNENLFDEISKKEHKEAISEALLLLPANESLTLRLFYLEEATIQEISEITGWKTNNIKVILYRGRKNLRQKLVEIIKIEV